MWILKKLNEKYNGIAVEAPSTELVSEVAEVIEPAPVVITPPNENVVPVVNPAPTFNIPNVEVPNIENNVSLDMANFELPKLDTPVVNNQNNEPISFSGNLFEAPSQSVANLMQTTDNFNSVPTPMPTTEVPVTPVPFFGPHTDTTSNPIPVGGPVNTMPNIEPTMFGQLQQNYM